MSQDQDTAPLCRAEEGCDRPAKTRGLCHKHYHRLWREENREERREKDRCWREENKDRLKVQQREWYLANRERVLRRQKEQEARDPEAYRKRKREGAERWRKENPERYRENHRRAFARRKYGLTLEAYEAILARGCAICGVKHDPGERHGNKGPRKLCVDHDHTTGQVRDALCHHCNTGLGSLRDDPALLRKAADYIESHR